VVNALSIEELTSQIAPLLRHVTSIRLAPDLRASPVPDADAPPAPLLYDGIARVVLPPNTFPALQTLRCNVRPEGQGRMRADLSAAPRLRTLTTSKDLEPAALVLPSGVVELALSVNGRAAFWGGAQASVSLRALGGLTR
jgi:hypothetical protein